MTGQLINDLVYDDFEYFKVTFVPELALLRGNGYNPYEDDAR